MTRVLVRKTVYITVRLLYLVGLSVIAALAIAISDAARPPYLGVEYEVAIGFGAAMFLMLVYYWHRHFHKSLEEVAA